MQLLKPLHLLCVFIGIVVGMSVSISNAQAATSAANSSIAEINIDKQTVVVGLGVRPPFLTLEENQGAGPDIVNALNKVQQKYHFIIKAIPPKRKLQAIREGWVDIMMWDNTKWGWQSLDMQSSLPLVNAKDVYIALKREDRSQGFFDNMQDKKLALTNGYHYKFTGFETDAKMLHQAFDLILVRTEEAAMRMVVSKRVQASAVSNTGLNWFLIQHPEHREKLLVSDVYDTAYSRHFLVPYTSHVDVKALNQALLDAEKQGLLTPIYNKYGLVKPTF